MPERAPRGTLSVVDPALVRAFAQRDRARAARAKRAHWAELHASDPLATLAASGALHEHLRAVRPGYPTAADRAEDLAHHIEQKRLLDRASRALAVR